MRTKAGTEKIRQTSKCIKAHCNRFDIRTMCRVLEVVPSGYYACRSRSVSGPSRTPARRSTQVLIRKMGFALSKFPIDPGHLRDSDAHSLRWQNSRRRHAAPCGGLQTESVWWSA
jgi:hypothetical protein